MIYAYTINYKTGAVKEYRGYIARVFSNKLQFHAVDETGEYTGHYLTGLPLNEGVARGQSVWFTYPNLSGAVEAFRNIGHRMVSEYQYKQGRSELWASQVQ